MFQKPDSPQHAASGDVWTPTKNSKAIPSASSLIGDPVLDYEGRPRDPQIARLLTAAPGPDSINELMQLNK